MSAESFVMQGLITAGDRDIIIEGLDQIERLIQEGKFEWRKDREDVHMNIEAALIERVGEPAKKLHTARSRNDQIVTDLRLWCRDSIDKILIRIKQLQVCPWIELVDQLDMLAAIICPYVGYLLQL